jgi:hypothetical protein
MGLLDDAIREHLELKRLKGADPGDVARAEQNALGPMHRQGGAESDEQADSQPEAAATIEGSLFSEPKSASDSAAPAPGHGSQETVEINMEAELKQGIDVRDESNAPNDERVTPVGHPAHTQVEREESTEWEMSGGRRSERGEIATAESDNEPPTVRDSYRGEHIKDVAEETPGFAQDTPEQKRPWFKRRARRNLDSDD